VTVTEMSRPQYGIVGPGYYAQTIPPATNLRLSHMRDNGVERCDYRNGAELSRISEAQKNHRLGPGLYRADLSNNIDNPSNWKGIGILENTETRFKPTPIADEDEAVNAEIEAGRPFRESPALSKDRQAWTEKRGPILPGERRNLLPRTPAPHMRRCVTCPPDPNFFLKKDGGMTVQEGVIMVLAEKRTRDSYHDEFFNTQEIKPRNGIGPKYPTTLNPKQQKLADWQRREVVRMTKECPQVLFRKKCAPWTRESPFTQAQNRVLKKSTLSSLSGTLARDESRRGNVARCAFDSKVERTVESVRSFCPHMTEMSKKEYLDIGPGAYSTPKGLKHVWNGGKEQNKGFGTAGRGLTCSTPRKPESFFVKDKNKKKRNLNLSMFSTQYLMKSHRVPRVPQVSMLLT